VDEPERPLAGRAVLLNHLGAGDVGWHEVRGELNAAEAQVHRVGDGADHQRLGQPGHADEQAVAAGQDREQELLQHIPLADDHLGRLGEQFTAGRGQPFDGGEVGVRDRDVGDNVLLGGGG